MNTIMKRNNGAFPGGSFTSMVDKIFQDNLSRFFDSDLGGTRTASVPVNIRETDTSYELELVAPGHKREDFKINVNGDVLTVSLEHNEENSEENKNEGWVRKEYKMQSFSRIFTLDDSVNPNKIVAKYSEGILRLQLPKKEGVQRISRSIEIE